MMHTLLGTTVSLAVFALVYTLGSAGVCCTWRMAAAACRDRSASFTSGVLFALRVLPFILATVMTLGITVPSFLLLEPDASSEPVGVVPFALAGFCLALLMLGIVRALRSQHSTTRAVTSWMRGAVAIRSAENVIVHQAAENAPALVVAGMRTPRVIASKSAMAALSEDELASAIRHEIAHVRRHDNFKKLLFRLCVSFGMSGLETAWAHAAELAADDEAVKNERDALDLAAALIKVSRLTAGPAAEFVTGLVEPASQSVSARVQRLLSWNTAGPETTPSRYIVPPAILLVVGVIVTYSAALQQMHAFTEWLVR